MDNLLEIKDLHVYFPTYYGLVKVLNGVNLNISHGTITGIVGETGSGKSMTGYSILKMLKKPGYIESGEILFEGLDLAKVKENDMRNIRGKTISLIPQGTGGNLNPTFNIGEQICAVLMTHQKLNKKQALEKAEKLLNDVGIPEPKKRLKSYPHELSGGMCQRVMIAIGLACKPKLLIADEPTTGLDVTVQAQILELIQELIKNIKSSCILITHDLGVVAEMCDYTAVMYAGQIVEYGRTQEIFNDPIHPYTKNLIKATLRVDMKKEIYSIPGIIPDLRSLPKGCSFAPRCEMKSSKCCVSEVPIITTSTGRVVKCYEAGDLI